MKKRICIYFIVAILSLSSIPSIVLASSLTDEVTMAEAQAVALNCIKANSTDIARWDGATIDKPVNYFLPSGIQSAYEFSVVSKGEKVGYIFVSAKKDWMPILEYSDGIAPSTYVADVESLALEDSYIDENDRLEPIFYYWGACTYSVQLGEKMQEDGLVYNLPSGLITKLPEKDPNLQMDGNQAKDLWADIDKNVRSRYEYCISGVPDFYQSVLWIGHGDDHDPDADEWPDCVGVADDPWADWDGCSPISGAMVIGYWHDNGYPYIPDPNTSGTEDTLIDHCHYVMGTNYDGYTDEDDIGWGLMNVPTFYGYYSFITFMGEATWSWTTDEIDEDRPFVLSMLWSPTYGNHSVCVYGYKDDVQDYIIIHDPNGPPAKVYVTWGDWALATMDTLEP